MQQELSSHHLNPSPGRVYFVSDAHLRMDEGDSPKQEKLLGLFREAKTNASHLYIVGDLFDFWFEYRFAIPAAYLKVTAALLELTSAGVNVAYVPGNHDFWMRDYLRRQAGVELTGQFLETNHFGKRILVTHGDGLRKGELSYRLMKRIFRNKTCIWLYSLLPVNVAYRLAMNVSRASRCHTAARQSDDAGDYIEFARKKTQAGYDAVVMGHLHKPEIVDLGQGLYVNCGDFFRNFSYVTLDEKGFRLSRL